MTTEISSFDKLIDEFSNIKVDIEICPQSYITASSEQFDEDGTTEYPIIYDFYLKFQNEIKVSCYRYIHIGDEYLANLNNLRLNFYEKIDLEINNSENKLHILNLLSSWKIRFAELLGNYYEYQIDTPAGPMKLKSNKVILTHYSEVKPINDYTRARILDGYLNHQIETIKKILKYLEEKISLFKIPSHIENDIAMPAPEKKERRKKVFLTKSFELKYKSSDSHFKMIKFKNELERFGFIEPIHFQKFVRVFTNQDVIQHIIWKKKPSELFCLIRGLQKKRIINRPQNYWQVTCKCFILKKDDKLIKLNPAYMARNKYPKNNIIRRDLNAVLLAWE